MVCVVVGETEEWLHHFLPSYRGQKSGLVIITDSTCCLKYLLKYKRYCSDKRIMFQTIGIALLMYFALQAMMTGPIQQASISLYHYISFLNPFCLTLTPPSLSLSLSLSPSPTYPLYTHKRERERERERQTERETERDRDRQTDTPESSCPSSDWRICVGWR